MRICFIGDGNSIHVQRWVGWFGAKHEVLLLSTTAGATIESQRVLDLPSERGRGTRLLRSLAMVRRSLASYKPDLLHSHYINEAGWLGAAARTRPLVVTAWGSDVYRAPAESPFARRLNPWAVRHADWVTCDSQDQAGVLRSWGADAERVSVIGWGVDREQFHLGVDGGPFARALGIPDAARVLLSPRQWNANSHVAQIVAAHGRLGEDVYLILKSFPGRGGNAIDEVQRAVTASPARDRVRIVGDLEPGELPGMYAAADVVISTCATDGTPVSVLEAMAVGRFIVALDNPSLAEWVSQPGGSLVEAPAPEAIASAVTTFYSDRDGAARARDHNDAVISQRADRATEFGRMDGIYEQLHQERTAR